MAKPMPPALRRALRPLRDRLHAGTSALWRVVLPRLLPIRPPIDDWFTPRERAPGTRAPQRILVIAPHPDDEVAGCGAVLGAHRDAGDAVAIVCLTDGRASRALGLEPNVMAARRRAEAEATARLLGADLRWLGLSEARWWDAADNAVERAAVDAVAAAIAETRPHRIYAPSRIDFHPGHARAARALARALGGDASTELFVYPVQVPLAPFLANRWYDASADAARLDALIAGYATQAGTLRVTLRRRRLDAALVRRKGWVEAFWRCDVDRYRAIHGEPPGPAARTADAPWRGLRVAPWTDPLAYWQGMRVRARLAQEPLRERPGDQPRAPGTASASTPSSHDRHGDQSAASDG